VFGAHLQQRLQALGMPKAAMEQIVQQRNRLTQIQLPAELDLKKKNAAESAIKKSFLASFRTVMLLSAALSFLSALGALTMIDGGKRSRLSG
jgi:anti-anti-sigma regulatory factor